MANRIEAVLSFDDIFKAMVRHRQKAVVVFCTIVGLTVLALVVWPQKFRSEGKLFVTLGRQSVALDPTATTGQVVSVNESREIQINSIIEMIRSRAMAEKVVDRIGAEVVNGTVALPAESPQLNEQQAAAASTPSSTRESAVTRVEKAIYASAPAMSTVVSVECSERSSALAQRIVATLMDEYLAEHVRVHRTAGSHKFFDEQAKLLNEELDKATSALCAAKNELGIASIAGRKKTLETQIAAVEQHIITTDTSLASSRSKVSALQSRMGSLPNRIVTQHVTGFANLGPNNAEGQLFQLQLLEREMLSKFTERHPQVVAIREQVARAKRLRHEIAPAPGQSTMAANPAFQQIELTKLNEQANIEALLAQAQKLQDQHQQIREELRKLNFAEIHIDELQRDVEMATTNFIAYSDKLELARIDEAMQGSHISNVNIMQEANFVSKPISPKKALVLLAGLVLAVVGAYVTVMGAELFDGSLRSREDIEKHLDLRVLGSIPQVERHMG